MESGRTSVSQSYVSFNYTQLSTCIGPIHCTASRISARKNRKWFASSVFAECAKNKIYALQIQDKQFTNPSRLNKGISSPAL